MQKQLDDTNKPNSLEQFHWNNAQKHRSVKIQGSKVQQDLELFYGSVLLDPQLSLLERSSVKLKILGRGVQMLYIADFKQLQDNVNQQGMSYSQLNNGDIFTSDGKESTKSFSFDQGDIIELQWDGPMKTFTTIKTITKEKFEFKVNFDADSQIHFAISLRGKCSIEII